MSRRAVMIVVLGLGLVAALKPEAEAHLAGTIKGIHYSSFLCIDEVSGVPGSALGADPSKPAFVVCTVLGKQIEILCQNSQGHEVANSAAINITVEASNQINEGDIFDKKKGIAHEEITVSDEPFLDPQFCTSPTWIPIQVLVTDIQVTVNVKQCTDSTCGTIVTTSTEVQDCLIPSEFGVENLPPDGTPYNCEQVLKAHLK